MATANCCSLGAALNGLPLGCMHLPPVVAYDCMRRYLPFMHVHIFTSAIGHASDVSQPITNYQMATSKRGAGGGSATHKEPT